ncbi:hypothetical protein MJO29_014586 [Puccinia striiformis f. sp. tritici]|uniref:Glutaredoxin domain-containing protein n=1 Tax=Puccinia striiformis f. sp. tritici PST-78 TaxID=1165861 RepID=A0A0L0VSH2_9BASI|nr:hypothetical protein Pst134EA_027156 [Puccinia striiformis f. sp. tritici]KAH9450459.1 hypothetical protein Pst134EA_027156 [Puccinia striiformis f. sp. tritici]KAI7939850.1 hypothetical protein MJO29_014586 [Puccinia striiformis f. sp. tritici]KNF02233.1 hypothetical protein PSTG_04444 [Puccinia striiformis f. sp. tritici PST-78]
MGIKEEVDEAIRSNPILIYSKTYCPHSQRAKRMISSIPSKISNPKVIELDSLGQAGVDMQSYLFELTRQRTVPNIFIHQNHIGGADDLSHLNDAGVLRSLVTTVPAAKKDLDHSGRSKFEINKQDGSILILLLVIVVFGYYKFKSTREPEKQKL